MKDNFNLALKEVLKSEGGYSNNIHDPGGPTNFGITIRDYRAYINPNGNAHDVKTMTVDQAGVIYKTKYWDKVNGDRLPSGVDYCVFDYGVNSGNSRANRVYNQKAAVIKDVNRLIDAICDERLAFLKGLSTWPYFRKGWTVRVAHVRAFSKELASKVVPLPKPAPTPQVAPQKQESTWPFTQIKNWWQRRKSSLKTS
jgi:lysozyme family protein